MAEKILEWIVNGPLFDWFILIMLLFGMALVSFLLIGVALTLVKGLYLKSRSKFKKDNEDKYRPINP